MANPDDILAFWLDEVGAKRWYESDAALDAEVAGRFRSAWQSAQEGALGLWLTHASGALAYIILNDQFPRNMFRDTGRAFSSDAVSRAAAKMAISRNWDTRIDPPARQFFYLPLMHSENLSDQDRSVRLFHTRMDGDAGNNLLHARAHREVIRRFGRFPTRNAALGRRMQGDEQAFVDDGGYGAILRTLRDTAPG